MASIVKEITIDAPAATVWAAVRDFGNVHNLVPDLLADCQPDGDARVVTTPAGWSTPSLTGHSSTATPRARSLPSTLTTVRSSGPRTSCPMSLPT